MTVPVPSAQFIHGIAPPPVASLRPGESVGIAGYCFRKDGGQIDGMRARRGKEKLALRRKQTRRTVALIHSKNPAALSSGYTIEMPVHRGSNRVLVEARIGGSWIEVERFNLRAPWHAGWFWGWFGKRRGKEQEIESACGAWLRKGGGSPPGLEPGRPEDALLRFSVLMPVFNPEPAHLEAAIESVRTQTWVNWELIAVDDGSTRQGVPEILARASREDARIRVVHRSERGHIVAATNDALALAGGAFVVFMDHDDLLDPAALATFDAALRAHPEAGLLYSDEDHVDDAGRRRNPTFKPSFQIELLLAQNFVGHLCACRTSLVRELGGLKAGTEGSQDWDLALRIAARVSPTQILHVPYILYHWRMAPTSTARCAGTKPYALEAGVRAVRQALQQRGLGGCEVQPDGRGRVRVVWPTPEPAPPVSLVIPVRNRLSLLRQCLDTLAGRENYNPLEVVIVDNGSNEEEMLDYLASLEATAAAKVVRFPGAYNFAALVNAGVGAASGDVAVLVNNDIEFVQSGGLRELVSHALRTDVGAVGAKLLYPDGNIQHAGVFLGLRGSAGHYCRGLGADWDGCGGRAQVAWQVAAVTGAMMAIRREIYLEAGGFDEAAFPVVYNDVDFCLRLAAKGLRTIYTPHAVFVHHESASRGKSTGAYGGEIASWKALVSRHAQYLKSDPWHHPALSLEHEDLRPSDRRVSVAARMGPASAQSCPAAQMQPDRQPDREPVVLGAEPPARPSKCRVCFATNNIGGLVRNGVATANTSLADLLAAQGHDVTILFSGRVTDEEAHVKAVIEENRSKGIRFETLPPCLPGASPLHHHQAWAVCQWLMSRDTQEPWDVIHLTECQGHGYYVLHAKAAGLAFAHTTLAVTTHGSLRWCHEGNGRAVFNADECATDLVERVSIEMADVVLAPSRHMKEWIEAQGWKLPAQTIVRQYVLPLAERPVHAAGAAREIVLFGRLERRKGLHHFVEAISRLPEHLFNGVSIAFLGEPSMISGMTSTDFIRSSCERWPLPWKILDKLGHREALDYIQGDGRLPVIASVHDNLPNTILECLALKLPFICSSAGGIPELIHTDDLAVCSYQSEPDPVSGLASAIEKALLAGSPRVPRFAVSPAQTNQEWLTWHAALAGAAPDPACEAQNTCQEGPCLSVHILLRAVSKQAAADFVSRLPEGFASQGRVTVFYEREAPQCPCVLPEFVHELAFSEIEAVDALRGETAVSRAEAMFFADADCTAPAEVFDRIRGWIEKGRTEMLAFPIEAVGEGTFLPLDGDPGASAFGFGPGPVFVLRAGTTVPCMPVGRASSVLGLWHRTSLHLAQAGKRLTIHPDLCIQTPRLDEMNGLIRRTPFPDIVETWRARLPGEWHFLLEWIGWGAFLDEELERQKARANRFRDQNDALKREKRELKSAIQLLKQRRPGLCQRLANSWRKRFGKRRQEACE